MHKDKNLYGQISDDFYEFKLDNEYIGFLVQRKDVEDS